MKLLNVDANPKTVKGQARGFMTAVLYLAPWKSAGINLCPSAEIAGCAATCLNTAGRGGIAAKRATFAPYGVTLPDNAIQRARIARTLLFAHSRAEFMRQLVSELRSFIGKAERRGLIPCVRLNGTSDIRWEREPCGAAPNVFAVFPELQFYDYTKLPARTLHPLPANYHLSISYSAANAAYAAQCLRVAHESGAPLVMVARDKERKAEIMASAALAEDGDEHDLRFLSARGSTVVLKAKGAARRETNGFVL
jgi:hypothetical protein